jgi:hypothetical protein
VRTTIRRHPAERIWHCCDLLVHEGSDAFPVDDGWSRQIAWAGVVDLSGACASPVTEPGGRCPFVDGGQLADPFACRFMKPLGNRQDADFSCKAEGHGGRVTRATLYRVLAALLIVIAAALTWSHLGHLDPLNLQPAPRTILGILRCRCRHRRRPDRRYWR